MFFIRSAMAEDVDSIVQMCKSSLIETYGAFLDTEAMRAWVEGSETEDYVQRVLKDMFVADKGDSIIGVVSIEDGMIGLLWIAAKHRGTGIGTKFLMYAEDVLQSRGHDCGRVECFAPNVQAMDFYRSRGWKKVKSQFDNEAGVDKAVLEKELAFARVS